MMGLTLFIKEAITHPSRVGALFPSSRHLASSLAKQIPMDNPGLVIELGAGTGAITAALLHQVSPQHELLIIERSAKFAQHLARRFPALTIIQGDASQLHQLLSHYTSAPIHAIVSSLPLRTLPPDTVTAIGEAVDRVLQQGGLFIQYTYKVWGKVLAPSQGLKLLRHRWVWQNLPPARIDVFSKE